MNSSSLQRTAITGKHDANAEFTFDDPWEGLIEGRGKRDNWLLSYIDILTLFLTLFVVLLVLTPKNEAPPINVEPGEIRFISPEPIERRSATPAPDILEHTLYSRESPKALPESTPFDATGETRESPSPRVEPFSLAALLEEALIVPISMPAREKPAAPPAAQQPEPRLDEKSLSSETDPPQEVLQPELVERPAAVEARRDQVSLFMERLAKQNLGERVRVSAVAEGVHLEVNDNILFALGSADLKPDGATLLDELAQLLLGHTGMVSVEGHTDDRPIATSRFPSNWELSSGRATTVTRYLIDKGMKPEQLRAVGYADTRPLESHTTAEGRARNRRVALIVEIPEAQPQQAE